MRTPCRGTKCRRRAPRPGLQGPRLSAKAQGPRISTEETRSPSGPGLGHSVGLHSKSSASPTWKPTRKAPVSSKYPRGVQTHPGATERRVPTTVYAICVSIYFSPKSFILQFAFGILCPPDTPPVQTLLTNGVGNSRALKNLD